MLGGRRTGQLCAPKGRNGGYSQPSPWGVSRTLATTQSGPCVLVREREPQVELENAYAKASNSLSASMRLRQELNYTGPGIQSYVISWFTRRDGNGDWEGWFSA
jgi:hypothetical protein